MREETPKQAKAREETPEQAKAREDAAKAKAVRDAARLAQAAKEREEMAAKAAATARNTTQKKPSVAVPRTPPKQSVPIKKEAQAQQPAQSKAKPVPAAVVTPPPSPQVVETKPEIKKAKVVQEPITKASKAVKQDKKVTASKPVIRESQSTERAAAEVEHDYRVGPILKTIELLSGKLKDKISKRQNENGLLARLKRILGSGDEKDLKALKAIKDNIDRIGKLTASDESKLKTYVEKHAPKPSRSR